jgi:hypothetical protein
MAVMRMVEVSGDQIVDVVAMRDRFVATARTVDMLRFMLATVVTGRAAGRVLFAD